MSIEVNAAPNAVPNAAPNAPGNVGNIAASGAHVQLRLGMVGGGRGAFIGAVHRIAARLDNQYALVAGALSSDRSRALASAHELGIAPERCYASYQEMARAEAARPDGIEVVAIVTPNHLHHPVATAFLEQGIHVVCDKPLTTNLEDALALVRLVRSRDLVFGLTHNYSGYPLVRHARRMVRDGKLGTLRLVQVEYPQDWLTEREEADGNKQAEWRTDPERAGPAGCVGDIGTHAYQLAAFVTGLELDQVLADLSTFVPGRALDDNAHILLRYAGGARGILWASQVAPGNENALRLRVYGDKGGLAWSQEHPNHLEYTPFGEPTRTLTRASGGLSEDAERATRLPPGHPEGYLEGFANLYSDVAEVIKARQQGRAADPLAGLVPTVEDGARGVRFIEAVVQSAQAGAVWVDARLEV